jgi:hypothetical protein
MSAWIVPVILLITFFVLLVPASRLVQRMTGRSTRLSVAGLVSLAAGVGVSTSLVETFVSLGRPWRLFLAVVTAGLCGLAAQALFGKKTPE